MTAAFILCYGYHGNALNKSGHVAQLLLTMTQSVDESVSGFWFRDFGFGILVSGFWVFCLQIDCFSPEV